MRIVFYIDQLYLHGGIEKMLSQKLNFFSQLKNYEVHLITFEQKNKEYCYPISDKIIKHDLEINYSREKSYFSRINLQKIPKHISRLKKKLKEIKPDVIVVANYSFDFYFIPFISRDIKTIKEYHSSRYDIDCKKKNIKGRIFYYLDEFINSKYDKIVVLNKDEKKHYTTKNVEVIPNSVVLNSFVKNESRKKTIVAAGRIAPVKQFDHLIKAWSLIAHKCPDWNVEIYGDGDEVLVNELNTLIRRLDIPRIKLMGATDELDNIMQQSSIFALTSATECFPMVLLESLKNGLPIVSYNSPYGPKNIIKDNEDGLLVEHNNIKAFASKLMNIIEDDKKRKQMEETAVENSKRFGENIIMQKWILLFESEVK